MTHVVAEPCINCKYTECVAVCPVDCFREGVNFLVIHIDECIDCGACVPVCPADAIFEEDDLPEKWKEYLEIAEKYQDEWPVIDEQKDPMPEADKWAKTEEKRDKLDSNAFEG
jgi:ferredoxin